MSSVFGLNKPNTELKKNVFDLSAQNLFTLSAGMLLPCMCREMNPGEKAQVSIASLTRTQPLNTAAFVRSRQFFHFFFVPYRQLWSGWDNFITGMDYRTSAIQKTTFNSRVPSLDIFGVIKKLVTDGIFGTNPTVTNTISKDRDELGYKYDLGVSRLLDMLGYGFRFEDGDKRSSSLAELLEAVGRGKTSELGTLFSVAEDNKVLVNPFRLLAYQKIYSDFYKRDDYEGTDPLNFNLDDFDGSTPISGNVDAKRLLNMLRLRYRWLPKDYFTGVVPSELFNVGNLDPNKLLPETRLKFDDYNLDDIFRVSADGSGVTLGAGTDAGRNSSFGGVSTRSIRAAFAIEKMLRISRRAGAQDYISQISAHYGFDVPQGRGDKVDFIDGWSSNINISEVLTTATTQQGFTGQIAGKGLGSTELGKELHYTAKEHGVLMCITSVVPDTEYSSEGMNRFNLKFERGDYFQPELQDLGLQPVMSDELLFIPQLKNKQPKPPAAGSRTGSHRLPSILGYAPRYCEYKACYDELHGEFRNGRSLSAWSSSTLVAPASYNPSTMTSGVSVSSLLVNPKSLDRVFSVNFDGSEKTDQFMCAMQVVCKMIRPMSITGQQL